MTRAEATTLLGLDASIEVLYGAVAWEDAVRLAWRQMVRKYHSDTGTDNAVMLLKVTKARDLLLQTGPEPCTSCKGVGKVRRRFGSVDCGACKGTGDRQ